MRIKDLNKSILDMEESEAIAYIIETRNKRREMLNPKKRITKKNGGTKAKAKKKATSSKGTKVINKVKKMTKKDAQELLRALKELEGKI